jgi:hypothetical protein
MLHPRRLVVVASVTVYWVAAITLILHSRGTPSIANWLSSVGITAPLGIVALCPHIDPTWSGAWPTTWTTAGAVMNGWVLARTMNAVAGGRGSRLDRRRTRSRNTATIDHPQVTLPSPAQPATPAMAYLSYLVGDGLPVASPGLSILRLPTAPRRGSSRHADAM